MRSLANRLQVKAASLYWHVRDRRELLELLAESILASTPRGRRGAGWRQTVLASAESLRRRVSAQQDATRVLLEVPEALEQSAVFADIRAQLVTAGLRADEAGEVAMMVMTSALSTRAPAERPTGLVPIHISSGVVNVSLHRPRAAAVVAVAHTGAVKLKLDDFSTKVVISDVHWQSEGALEAQDRFDLDVSSGAVDLSLDTYTP